MNPSLSAQASQAAQQGQQLLSQDQSQAGTSQTNYNNYSSQANQAGQQLQSASSTLQGAGSGQNVYNNELGTLESQNGYDPGQLASANKSLFAQTGALNSANNQFNTAGGVGAYGVSAPSLASYEGSILNPLQTGVSNANTEVGTLNNELGTFETGANQATTSEVQTEQANITALTNAATLYQTQAASALQNMQFYSQLAQQQGGLNAQEQQSYASAAQAYAAAGQAAAQTKLILSQTTGQNITNTADQNQLNSAEAASKAATAKTAASTAAQSKSNQEYTTMEGSNPYTGPSGSSIPNTQNFTGTVNGDTKSEVVR